MSEPSVVRQEPLLLNRFTTQTVERNGITFINRPEGVVASWEPPPGFDPHAHAQQHNLTNIGYETHTDSMTGETHSVAYTEMTHEEYETLRQSPQGRTLELPPMVPETIGNNFGKITFKPAVNPVRAELANPPEIPPEDVENPEAPSGERTSKKLDELKAQREANNKKLINTDIADEYVRFNDLHGSLNDLISNIKGEPGTLGDYVAQRDRAAIGFVKDAFLGVGELVYEGSKLVFDAQQAMLTPAGIQGQILDAQIFLEEIRLGNVTTGTMSNGVMNTASSIGKALIAPVTEPWAKGQYVEAVTRALIEIATLPFVALKSSKVAKGADALTDAATVNKTTEVTSEVSNANKATNASDATKTLESKGPSKDGDGGKVEPKTKVQSRIDYSQGFERDLSNFKPGHELIDGPLKEDLVLTSYHADVPLGQNRSAKWWTSTDQANNMTTIDDIHQSLALPPEWGAREAVTVIKIPKGTNITAYKGLASPQIGKTGDLFSGNGVQYRFKDFDPEWIIKTKSL